MSRLAPFVLTAVVATADFVYGRFAWSWLAGPIAGFLLWSLRDTAEQPVAPVPARSREPRAFVD